MTAILLVAEDWHVIRFILDESGKEGEPQSASDPTFRLSNWLANSWRVHDIKPTSMQGGPLAMTLRGQRKIDDWKANA